MATPVGHALVGALLARRLGVRSPAGLASAVVASGLPDIDVIVGALLHRDPWKLHKQGTHTLAFTTIAGMFAGLTGVVSAGSAQGERDLIADALAGAVISGSHIALDRAPLPYMKVPKRGPWREMVAKSAYNWTLDGVVYGAAAFRFWPRA
jgi:membrane-bound metal-dependent hydrolase YbcI (DUF457 family)